MEIEFVDPNHVLVRELRGHTLPFQTSGMNGVLNYCEGRDSVWGISDTGKFCLAREGDVIIGWGVAAVTNRTRNRMLMIFVDPEYRRRGVGSQICNALRRRYKNTCCMRWNDSSRSFYDRLKVRNY